NIDVCLEGFVLLKNESDTLPIEKNLQVSVFGKNSVNLAYSGSGSGGFAVEPSSDLFKRMSANGIDLANKTLFDALDGYFDHNPTLEEFYENDQASGPDRSGSNVDLDSGDDKIYTVGETPVNLYTDSVIDSYENYKDLALVVITRIGGEGADLPRHQGNSEGAVSEDSHYLELDQNEIDMFEHIKEAGFQKIVVLLNIPSAMEADFLFDTEKFPFADDIDAALWIGYTGKQGIMALGPILTGEVSPSGKTVDTWATDFLSDPSSVNFGTGIDQAQVTNPLNSKLQPSDKYYQGLYYFVTYEEGPYVGYRYYETRGFTDGEAWYDENVVFPFGYGLSYTDFEWTIKPSPTTSFTKNSNISIAVEVQNTGRVPGMDVVQIYASAPYTEGGIEKAHKVLVGFAKTKLLNPSQKETLTITIDPYDFASYDDRDANNNGFCGYELESGDYDFYISHDSHDSEGMITLNLASDARFETDTLTNQNVVGNRYINQGSVTDTDISGLTDIDAPLDIVLSRSDWTGTWPTPITDSDRNASTSLINELQNVITNNPIDYYDVEEYAMFDQQATVKVRDLLPTETPEESWLPFVDYDDERWQTILESCNAANLIEVYNQAAYQTKVIRNVEMPATLQADGPSGFTCFMNKEQISGTNQYASQPVFASTWNVELIEKLGKTMGDEGIWGYDLTGQPYSSIYAPGVNIHRSQFGGRCSEYFSEDPFITGKIAAAEIRGLQSKGVVPMIKHFAVNEQETHRSINGDCSWLTEQSLREIYLKAFEIAIKDSDCRGLMTSFNRIGSMWTGGDYRLLTEILRDEWGFKGAVICDFNTNPQYMNGRQMAYAGGDLNLQTNGGGVFDFDENDNGDAVVLQTAMKNMMYALVNSNAMNGEIIGYKLPVWIAPMIIIDGVVVLVSAAVVFLCFYKKKN
ncbi:MAG: glycoside hydrolase family 3 N-terminal domain-containing protein, partial [Candidatus Izemoplasmatales bacterium]|nr:glycoside hydrolase family 3 N-terminal domain-containing protein [Candidatus Izemoplasmatales bacterium]